MPWATPPSIWPSIKRGVHRATHVVHRRDAPQVHGAELEVDVQLDHVRAVAELRVGLALPVGRRAPWWAGRRSRSPRPRGRRRRPRAARDRPRRRRRGRGRASRGLVELEVGVGRHPGERQSSRARSSLAARNVALPETNVCRDAELFPASGVASVSAPSVEMLAHVETEGVGADLRHHGVRALTHVDRALEQRHAPVAPQAHLDRRGVRQRRIAASVPHAGETHAPARGAGAAGSTRPPRRALAPSAAAAPRGSRGSPRPQSKT